MLNIAAMRAERAARSPWAARPLALLAPFAKALVIGLIVVVITFLLGKLVLSDPGRLVLGTTATQQAVDAFNAKLGLNEPLLVQFGHYFANLLHGQLGDSFAYPGTSVWSLVAPALAVSSVVALLSVAVSTVLSIVLGVMAAGSTRRWADQVIRAGSLIGLSMPSAFVALVLILLVAVRSRALPAGGWGTSPLGDVPFLVLPVATLTIYLTPILVRVVRERALVVLDEPHVEAAIARGVPRWRVVLAHVVPNCAGPLLSVLGSNLGGLLSGSVITDVVFGLPGLGHVLTSAASVSDLPVLQGVALLSGLLVTVVNVLAETTQRLIDPRLRS
jgi:peptide/nickel transport system permease protein